MKKTCLFLFWAFLVCFVCGCSDHDEEANQEPSSSSVQVTVVFYPGQVGDCGYADDIMGSISQLEKIQTSGKSSHIDTQFFAFNSKRETLGALRNWDSHREDPFLGGNYQRRLLVLTDVRQVAWLDSLQSVNAQDELLLLNTSSLVIDSLAHSWGDRVHSLNISVSQEVKDLCRYILSKADANKTLSGAVDFIQMAGKSQTADSVNIAFRSMLYDGISFSSYTLDEFREDTITGEINYTYYQQYANQVARSYYENNKNSFIFVDGGSYNLVFDDLSLEDESYITRTAFLDTDVFTNNYCIKRQYGKALVGWVADWMKASSPDAMPRVTWHGSWDGYVDSTVPAVK